MKQKGKHFIAKTGQNVIKNHSKLRKCTKNEYANI